MNTKLISVLIVWFTLSLNGLNAESIDSLITLLESADGDKRAEILNQLAVTTLSSDPDRSISFANQALELAVDGNNVFLRSEAYFNIAEGFKLKGENIKALDYLHKSMNGYLDINDRLGVAKSSNSIGRIYKFLGDFTTSLDYHLKAHRIFEDLGIDEGIASSLIYVGVVYRNLGNPDIALDYYARALAIARSINSQIIVVDALLSKGNVYWYKDQNEKALSQYQEAMSIIKKLNIGGERLAGLLNNIGNVYRSTANFSMAFKYYKESLEISEDLGDKNMIAITRKNMAITYKNSGNYEEAIRLLKLSNDLADKIKLGSVIQETLNELSETYALQGKFEQALIHYKKFTEVKQSDFQEQSSNKISMMQLGYKLKEETQKQTFREVDLAMKVLRERNLRNVIIFITLLAVSFVFILWSRNKLKSRNNQELRQLNLELEKRVEERTKRLREENERRKVAQEQAEHANETKNKFLANISHEVRTPINAIIGFCDLSLKSEIPDEFRVNLKRIKDSTVHLLSLIKDVLDYSQIDKGNIELKNVEFNLKEQLGAIINAFYLDALSKKIDLSFEIDEKLPSVLKGDKDAFKQIFYNLIGNALKFTEKGFIKLSIKAEEVYEESKKVKLFVVVEDSGIGISKLKQKLIFMDFTQENDTSNRKYGGAGLGLTISKHFIELMEGKIWVESDKGKGSKFMFNLNLNYIEEIADVEEKSEDTEVEKKKSLHMLVAEDNPLNAQVILAFLTRMGHTAEIAENGVFAIEKLAEKEFDAVLMDIEMPEMDGLEATKAIRNAEGNVKNPNIPIVALTAHALKDYEEKSRDAGMNDYLTKPVDIEQLASVLNALS